MQKLTEIWHWLFAIAVGCLCVAAIVLVIQFIYWIILIAVLVVAVRIAHWVIQNK